MRSWLCRRCCFVGWLYVLHMLHKSHRVPGCAMPAPLSLHLGMDRKARQTSSRAWGTLGLSKSFRASCRVSDRSSIAALEIRSACCPCEKRQRSRCGRIVGCGGTQQLMSNTVCCPLTAAMRVRVAQGTPVISMCCWDYPRREGRSSPKICGCVCLSHSSINSSSAG